jgi:hypothetical protein
MRIAAEFLSTITFFVFLAIEIAILLLIAMARILKTLGVFTKKAPKGGFLGFLQGFS